MVFFLGSAPSETYAVIGRTVGLRPLVTADHAEWARLRADSREHLTPFEPAWSEVELGRRAFRARLRHHAREAGEDLGYAFGVFRLDDHQLMGGISLTNVRRGVTQSAELGYWLARSFVRQGHMTEAVRLLVSHGFGHLRLHRIEAATLPGNTASIRVLERNGFHREGHARSYLKINGVWSDHVLFGLIEEDLMLMAGRDRDTKAVGADDIGQGRGAGCGCTASVGIDAPRVEVTP